MFHHTAEVDLSKRPVFHAFQDVRLKVELRSPTMEANRVSLVFVSLPPSPFGILGDPYLPSIDNFAAVELYRKRGFEDHDRRLMSKMFRAG